MMIGIEGKGRGMERNLLDFIDPGFTVAHPLLRKILLSGTKKKWNKACVMRLAK